MSSLLLLIPVTLILLSIAIGIYLWAIKNDQYSDLDREASRILYENKPQKAPMKLDKFD